MKRIITVFLCICVALVIHAQDNGLLTGKVTGSDGEILTGATIVAGGVDMLYLTVTENTLLK